MIDQETVDVVQAVAALAAAGYLIVEIVEKLHWLTASTEGHRQEDEIVLTESALSRLEAGGEITRWRWHGGQIVLEATEERDDVDE